MMIVKRCVSLSCVAVLACAMSVYACPKCPHAGAKATTVKADSKADSKTVAKKGCCDKSAKTAKTVANLPCHAKNAKLTGSKKDCPGKCHGKNAKAVLASLPAMSYRIGDFETQCHMAASAKSEETKTPITFIVQGKSFEDEGAATDALASAMEARVEEMSHIQFVAGKQCFKCPVSAGAAAKKANTKMKYRLAGFDLDSREKATALAEKVEKALADVKITMMAEGKAVKCAASCKKAGKKVTYVVGDEKTCCEHAAKLMLAQQKVQTIVKVVSNAAL